jgi:DNA-binding protein
MRVKKMKVNVNTPNQTSGQQTNPKTNPSQINNLNLQSQHQNQTINNPQSLDQAISLLNALLEKVSYSRQQLQQLLNQGLYPNELQNKTSNTSNNDTFIIKASMKASYIALKVEQLLIQKKKITLTALGYAVPVMLDTVMLVRKDFAKLNRNIDIESIELFEKAFRAKIVTGLKIMLKIQ